MVLLKIKNLIGVTAIFLTCISIYSNAYSENWATFQHDARHSGNSTVNFPNKELKLLWTFIPTQRVWSYKRYSSVWSSSACIANVNGKDMVFVGLYNNNLYAIDASSGNVIWRFIAGNRLDHAPYFAVINERPIVYIACADRTIYALDAATGSKIWSFETLEWNYMLSEAIVSSPIIGYVEKRPILICAVWNSSKLPFNSFQKGELFVLEPLSGSKIYNRILSSTPLNSPIFSYIKGHPLIFISSNDGNVFALDARDGKTIWNVTTCAGLYSSVSMRVDKSGAHIFVGSRFGNLYCLDAFTGKIIWTKKVGHAIDSTPAIATINGKALLYIGSYDRNVYAFDAATGDEVWRFKTGDYVVSSCALAKISGQTVVFVHSLDNRLYCLDGRDGSLVWRFNLGKLIWGYNTRGDTIWSSPAVSMAGDKAIVVFPCYDSKLYAYGVE